MSGQETLRPYWRHSYTGTQAVIYVVDATDRARLPIVAAELQNIALDDQLLVRAVICVVSVCCVCS